MEALHTGHPNFRYQETEMATTKTTEAAKTAAAKTVEDATGFASKLTEAGKALFNGTIEVDKMILGHLADGAKETAEHGRSLLAAKDIKTAFEMQVGFFQNSVEQSVANSREVLQLTQSKLQDVLDPLRKSA
jgi:phasin family protein